MSIAGSFSFYILTFLQLLGVAGAAYAILHALRQRSDAFPAVDKLTKNAWLAILFVGLLLILVSGVIGFLGIIGVVAVCVYLVDVRPKIDGIQRGPRW